MTTAEATAIIEEQNTWHKRGQQGCVFASFLANPNKPAHSIWKKHVISGKLEASSIQQIKELVEKACTDKDTQVLSIILPDMKEEADLKLFISLLFNYYPNIEMDFIHKRDKDHTHVQIKIPIEEGIHSWMLGFINLEISPKTRKPPFAEIVIPTKSKQYLMEQYQRYALNKPNIDSIPRLDDEKSVHLADIQIEGITEITEEDNKLWDATSKKKKAKLEGDDDRRAKGKVSFTVAGNFNLRQYT